MAKGNSSRPKKSEYEKNLEKALKIVDEGEKVLASLKAQGYKVPDVYKQTIDSIRKKAETNTQGISKETLKSVQYMFRTDTLSRLRPDKSNYKTFDKMYDFLTGQYDKKVKEYEKAAREVVAKERQDVVANRKRAMTIIEDGDRVINSLKSNGFKLPDDYKKKLDDIKEAVTKSDKGISLDTLHEVQKLYNGTNIKSEIKRENESTIDKLFDNFTKGKEKKQQIASIIAEEKQKISDDKKALSEEYKKKREEYKKLKEEIQEERKAINKEMKEAKDVADYERRLDKFYGYARKKEIEPIYKELKEKGKQMDDIIQAYMKSHYNIDWKPEDGSIMVVNKLKKDRTYMAQQILAYLQAWNYGQTLSDLTKVDVDKYLDDDSFGNLIDRMEEFVENSKNVLTSYDQMKFKTKSMKQLQADLKAQSFNFNHYTTLRNLGWKDDEIRDLEMFIESSELWWGIKANNWESESIDEKGNVVHQGSHDIANGLRELLGYVRANDTQAIETFIIDRILN